jgi:hypothetical protein
MPFVLLMGRTLNKNDGRRYENLRHGPAAAMLAAGEVQS